LLASFGALGAKPCLEVLTFAVATSERSRPASVCVWLAAAKSEISLPLLSNAVPAAFMRISWLLVHVALFSPPLAMPSRPETISDAGWVCASAAFVANTATRSV
jgi:hypothetical protein